ncbi:CaiB/BaiF CoA transferase family protein [Microbacterium sp. zg.Y909]|uniref:CaiB/BaiF CoA transferase family protein n=1 Tax=Microbacterium sp. zg.Y909 TaxID=2969413 RepID=UPI00214AC568|nr:CoA transferase [Microbacterium sp. zg.Y909]MCR2828217.1 CoA transferase [Microbacterium sp. zg.Y909]
MRRPLTGVRVIDFSWVGAGSYATKILADLGAEVIKIESTKKVDGIRLSPPFAGGQSGVNRSGYFADRNTSKRSMLLNLKEPAAVDIALRLVAQAELVCNNFSAGVMDRLGLGYEAVAQVNPRIIYLSMSMNGDSGPERHARGYGAMMSAITGLHHLSGIPGLAPAGTGTNYPDHIPNPGHAAFAMLAALRHSRRTGRGQRIDMAQTEAMLATLGPELLDWTVNGNDRDPLGNSGEGLYWQDVLPTAGDDDWIAISTPTSREWDALLATLGLAAGSSREHALGDVATAVAARGNRELAEALQAAGIPAAPVLSPPEVIADPQLTHREHWRILDHPEMGRTLYNGQPFRFARHEVQPTRPAPLLGQHTDEICEQLLGLSPQEIADLRTTDILS